MEKGIAGAFQRHFQNVYSNHDSPLHELLWSEFQDKFATYVHDHIYDSISPCYLSWADMEAVIGKLKIGKSSSGQIKPEHIFHGCTKLVFHLHFLFNAMIQHGVVVDDFLKGTITPIVKDTEGDVCSSSNYPGITLGSLLSKLFEFAIDLKVSPFLDTDGLQFSFKKRTSTAHALFTLRSTVDYFNKRGSDIFAAFLDCSKDLPGLDYCKFGSPMHQPFRGGQDTHEGEHQISSSRFSTQLSCIKIGVNIPLSDIPPPNPPSPF